MLSTSSPNDNNQLDNRYSKRKRGLNPESPETQITRTAKKQKPSKMTENAVTELKELMKTMQAGIEGQINTSQTAIEKKISEFTKEINTEVAGLKSSFEDFKSQIQADINTLKGNINEHTQRLTNNEDDINRLRINADLRLIGVPFMQGENLIDMFHKIAATIGYDSALSSNMPFIKRILIRNKITGTMIESHVISIHFTSMQLKQQFYSLYLSKLPLNPQVLGLKKEMKITIGESLTRCNAQIFKYAQQCRKENKIAQLFTTDGLVKVKFVKGTSQRAYIIRSTAQLDALIKQNEQQQTNMQQEAHHTPMEFETASNMDTSNTLGSNTHAQTQNQVSTVYNISQSEAQVLVDRMDDEAVRRQQQILANERAQMHGSAKTNRNTRTSAHHSNVS